MSDAICGWLCFNKSHSVYLLSVISLYIGVFIVSGGVRHCCSDFKWPTNAYLQRVVWLEDYGFKSLSISTELAWKKAEQPGWTGNMLSMWLLTCWFIQDFNKSRDVSPFPTTPMKLMYVGIFLSPVHLSIVITTCSNARCAQCCCPPHRSRQPVD